MEISIVIVAGIIVVLSGLSVLLSTFFISNGYDRRISHLEQCEKERLILQTQLNPISHNEKTISELRAKNDALQRTITRMLNDSAITITPVESIKTHGIPGGA